MSLKHTDIWRAIDRLAEINGLSPSGLAIKAGLSSTVFNPSKRASKNRKRWPSTESIAEILKATGATLDEFVALVAGEPSIPRQTLPLLGYAQAGRANCFDDSGYPAGNGWDEIRLPRFADPRAFALEIAGKSFEPAYREGDRIIVSPAEKPRHGDRVLLRTDKGEIMVKQLGRESARKIELLPLNPAQPSLTLSPRAIEWMHRIVWASQ